MRENDSRLVVPGDVVIALALLTRLPGPPPDPARAPGRAAWAYPVAGLVAGGLAGLAGLVASMLGLPAPLAALAALAALVMLTGALHEDGLADTADGLWGGWDRARRLEIMRDSRIGSYGVIALSLSLTARWAALWLLFDTGAAVAVSGLMAVAALSRATMPLVMAALPHARRGGLSHSVGTVPRETAALGGLVAVVAALVLLGWEMPGAVLWAGLAALAVAALARARIGGQTGDILGATQQIAEIAALFSLAA